MMNINKLTPDEEQTLITEFNTVSQLSHVAWGVMIILLFHIIGHSVIIDLIGLGLWTTYSGVKEFWYDNKYEIPVVRGSSLLDFSMQVGGALVGLLISVIFR
jgi:hypothetical protein